jgi:hypothetical protein
MDIKSTSNKSIYYSMDAPYEKGPEQLRALNRTERIF